MVDDQGVVQHAELTLCNGLVILGAEYDGFRSPTVNSTHRQLLYVFVDDADSHAEQARGHGATITSESTNRDYGARVYGGLGFGCCADATNKPIKP